MLDLDVIKARLDAACPGPWSGMTIKRPIDGPCLAIVREHAAGDRVSQDGARLTVAATLIPHFGDRATATMLLHARADIETLLAEVERLREEAHELRLMVEEAARAENANAEDAKRERAAVVAWLRGFDTDTRSASSDIRWCIRGLVNYIERGDHRREEKP